MVKPDDSPAETSSADPDKVEAAVAGRPHSHLFKVIILGDAETGKSALVTRFQAQTFQESYRTTVGVNFVVKTVSIPNGDLIKLQLQDMSGQERYRAITRPHYRRAHGALILYDVTDKKSLDNVKLWIQEVKKHAEDDVIIMVVGTKLDLKGGTPVVYYAESMKNDAEPAAGDVEAFHYVSSKTVENVDRTFRSMADALVSKTLGQSTALRGAVKNIWKKDTTVSLGNPEDKSKT